ncbi:SKICH domain-containing protein [Trichonephila inaurata madagascariensis]|uniref:SKICH domain-containing protein n=1 Tax=Trichonephila inaurata madagascariensis TaxID=2747483 RepID=A0A8X6WT19_9ARAC|nr:SKICH domain-containing protein [Trichonephila inaurata madagascariensis]
MEESKESSGDFSSISVVSEEWQEPCKFDYAKVIFSDLWYDANSNHVECKFQITDDLHEEPNSFVGLFPIGYNNLSECLIAKFLCESEREDDGKLQCAFNLSTVPHLKDGFYQFLYVNHDKEVCGASLPLEIKQMQNHPKELLDDSLTAKKVDNGFLLVSQIPSSDYEELLDTTDNEDLIVSSNQHILSWKSLDGIASQSSVRSITVEELKKENEKLKTMYKQLQQKNEKILEDYFMQSEELEQYKQLHKVYKEKKQEMQITQQFDHLHFTESVNDNNQFALKEISNLYESLNKSTKLLNSTKEKLVQCEKKLKDAATAQEKNEEIEKLCREVNDLRKTVEEKDAALITGTLKIEVLETEVENLKNEQIISISETKKTVTRNSEENCPFAEAANKIKALSTSLIELSKKTDFGSLSESKRLYGLKIQLLVLLSHVGKPIDGNT